MTEDDTKTTTEQIRKLLEIANDCFVNQDHYWREGHYDSHELVEGYYNQALKIDANNKMVLSAKSNFLVSKGRHDEAILCLNRILSTNPNDYETCFTKGMIFTELGLYAEAVQWINEGIQTREKVQTEQSSKRYDEWKEWQDAEAEYIDERCREATETFGKQTSDNPLEMFPEFPEEVVK